jgi:hypothetical protein
MLDARQAVVNRSYGRPDARPPVRPRCITRLRTTTLVQTIGSKRERYLARPALTTELDAHIALEEGEAFPIFAQVLGEGLMTTFFQEHVEIRVLREEALACAVRRSSCLRLCVLILDHQQREDMMLFPSAWREDAVVE